MTGEGKAIRLYPILAPALPPEDGSVKVRPVVQAARRPLRTPQHP
jgi:hypothetical protein